MRSKKLFSLGACLIASLVLVPTAQAQEQASLWNNQTQPDRSPYEDSKKETKHYKVHDHITIKVQDQLTANNSNKLDTKRESKIEFELEKYLRFKGGHLISNEEDLSPGIDMENSQEHKGSGRQSKQRSLAVTITAEVIEVLPNGNLLLEAKKSIQVDDDTESISLTGVVNPLHIDLVTDTVPSAKLHDLKVKTYAEGPMADAARPGWLMSLWFKIWPF